MMRKGIDVSDNQGYIDWAKVKQAGVEFAILRSVRGSGNEDKQLASNIKGCTEQCIPFSFYKFSYALSNSEAKKEALRVVKILKKYGIMPSKDVVIWGDYEWDKQLALGKKAVMEIMDNFKEIIVNSGYSYGVYAGLYAFEHQMDSAAIKDNLWLARYYNGYNKMPFGQVPNEKYRPDHALLWGWQFTSSGMVSGINGNVDMNISYFDFKQIEVATEYYSTPEFTLIDCLNKVGADSSYNNRKRIAIANGVENYTGTAAQNTELLNLLKNGMLLK